MRKYNWLVGSELLYDNIPTAYQWLQCKKLTDKSAIPDPGWDLKAAVCAKPWIENRDTKTIYITRLDSLDGDRLKVECGVDLSRNIIEIEVQYTSRAIILALLRYCIETCTFNHPIALS